MRARNTAAATQVSNTATLTGSRAATTRRASTTTNIKTATAKTRTRLPVIGLILYLVWYDEHRRRAKYAGKGALISVCVSVAAGIIIPIIMVIVAAAISIGAAAADPYAMFALAAMLL